MLAFAEKQTLVITVSDQNEINIYHGNDFQGEVRDSLSSVDTAFNNQTMVFQEMLAKWRMLASLADPSMRPGDVLSIYSACLIKTGNYKWLNVFLLSVCLGPQIIGRVAQETAEEERPKTVVLKVSSRWQKCCS